MPPDLAYNTAVSFLTDTNWQNYAGESTMNQLSQMVPRFFVIIPGLALAGSLAAE